jgi:hypothetical protein
MPTCYDDSHHKRIACQLDALQAMLDTAVFITPVSVM